MALVCPRCHRANPQQAIFCWFDGSPLTQGTGGLDWLPAANLPQEFVFPSGRRTRTIDDLVQGCQLEWDDARELLRKGELTRFFQSVGRADLARSAQEAQNQQDPDIALYNFVGQLPATQVQGPRLDLAPRRITLPCKPGDQKQSNLTLMNLGRGLLQGKVKVSEGENWLKLGDARERQLAVKTNREQIVVLHIDTRGLTGGQKYSGKLTVITNGGIAEVSVRIELTALPFPKAPFQGAMTQRQLAEKMRTKPKAGVPLLENGEVEKWFAANGWNYPVPGTPARGVAAVQQFFECLGLAKPPPLETSSAEVALVCKSTEGTRGQVVLRTPLKKWVYAQVDSDVPWLRILTPSVSGPQQATISFEADPSQMNGAAVHEGTVRIIANAGQRLSVRVRVDASRLPLKTPTRTPVPSEKYVQSARPAVVPAAIQPPPVAPVAVPPAEPPALSYLPVEPAPERPRPPPADGSMVRLVLAGALTLLVYRLLLVLPADVYARVIGNPNRDPVPGSLPHWLQAPGTEDNFLKLFVLATWWVGGLAGLVLVWKRGGKVTDLLCGALAGAAAGLVGSATVACVMIILDAVPRAILSMVAGSSSTVSPWVATPTWILLAATCWGATGALAGVVAALFGPSGRRWLGLVTAPLAWLLNLAGARGLAAYFALE
jgi:hypothetical protein